jgi:hypothetical protein
MEECMLTTTDNPFDPFTQFDLWFAFDTQKGYGTCGYLDRIARTSDALSDSENRSAIIAAIDEIIEMDSSNLYKKVQKSAKNS